MTSCESKDIELRWGIKIPVRDGISLNATVYAPRNQSAPAPCVLTLTPYVSDGCHERAMYFAAHGLPFVVVDVRGRGNSEGVFRPMIQEAEDGYDVVEWLAVQPYCDGQVGMYGGSYLGYAQWATAKERPPHLATIVPTAPVHPGLDFPMRNNIFHSYAIRWLTYVSGRARQTQIFADDAFWSNIYQQWHESGRPMRDLDTIAGNASSIFQEWLTHPEPDAYWDAYNPTADQYASLDLPILTITGSYDDDQPGALEHYKSHLHLAPTQRTSHYLIIGPWNHAGTAHPVAEFEGIKVGPASLVDMAKLHREWYAWTLQDGAKPELLENAVAYYVMGAEKWRYADSLDSITARHECLFLNSSGSANDVLHSGLLGQTQGTSGPDSYIYDPRAVSVFGYEMDVSAMRNAITDQATIIAMQNRLLVYHGAPFEYDTELSGFFKLSAWIAVDCLDTDFYVSVYEIGIDGSSIRLSTDVLRARYREGLRKPQLIETREPLRYDFERFTFVSRQVKRGHRLRLVISPMGRVIDSIFSGRNNHSGGVVAEECGQDAKPATVSLFHDESHPSALYIPLGRVASDDKAGAPASFVAAS